MYPLFVRIKSLITKRDKNVFTHDFVFYQNLHFQRLQTLLITWFMYLMYFYIFYFICYDFYFKIKIYYTPALKSREVNCFSSVHTSVLLSETIIFVLFFAELTDDSLWFSVCSLSLWYHTTLTNFTSVKQLLPFNRLDLFLNIYDQFRNISSHFLKNCWLLSLDVWCAASANGPSRWLSLQWTLQYINEILNFS